MLNDSSGCRTDSRIFGTKQFVKQVFICNVERLKGPQCFELIVFKRGIAAIEFRNDSWFDEETFDVLRAHAVAIGVSEDSDLPCPPEIATTDWLYLRLRKPGYTSQNLAGWIKKALATDATKTLAFFKHEDDGAGPELASRFLHLAQAPQPVRAPRRTPERKRLSKAQIKRPSKTRNSSHLA